MSSTTGLPLEIILQLLKDRNMSVDWVGFYEESLKHLWKWKTTRERIRYSVGEIYGPEYRDKVLKRLEFYKRHKETVNLKGL